MDDLMLSFIDNMFIKGKWCNGSTLVSEAGGGGSIPLFPDSYVWWGLFLIF